MVIDVGCWSIVACGGWCTGACFVPMISQPEEETESVGGYKHWYASCGMGLSLPIRYTFIHTLELK